MVDPNASGVPIAVRCDMTYDGGGWTLVGHELRGDPNSWDASHLNTGIMSSLYATANSPNDVAYGSADAFVGPLFAVGINYTSARLNYCNAADTGQLNRFLRFDTSEELFEDTVRASDGNEINLSAFTTNDGFLGGLIASPSSAHFCRAATSTHRSGDTSWGVKGTDTNFDCGCSSGGWTGQGAYYGGTGYDWNHNAGCNDGCDCWGGGWSGSVDNGGQKGAVNVNETFFWVR